MICATNSSRGAEFHVGVVALDAAMLGALRRMAEAQRPKWTMGVFRDLEALLAAAKARPYPDVVLLGLDAGGRAAAAAPGQVAKLPPSLPVIVIGHADSAEDAPEWLLAGARGFLVWPIAPEVLASAVGEAAAGRPVLCANAQRSVVSWLNNAGVAQRLPRLSPRERQVLNWLAQPLYYKQIGERLEIETETVHALAKRIFKKLRVHSRRNAVRAWLRRVRPGRE